jgi:DNA-binding transcriptional ArsR family regulator
VNATSPSRLELTDPRALRAVAHPVRLALIGLLRSRGPLTATEAAEQLGESPANCSFHLRQLAKYGLVEEAGRGPGRRRPWRATAEFTTAPRGAGGDLGVAVGEFKAVLARRYLDRLMAWLQREPHETEQWRQAEVFGDSFLYVTPEEMRNLGAGLWKLIEPYHARTTNPALRPSGSRLVTFISLGFPSTEP